MRPTVLSACTLACMLAASTAIAAPVVVFDGFLTTDNTIAAPTGFTPALAGPLGGFGGLQSGPLAFVLTDGGTLTITVADIGAVGDVFEVFGDGVALGITAPVAVDGPENSAGTYAFAVAAGAHSVDVWNFVLSYAGSASPYGGTVDDTFSPADVAVTVTFEVPEPAAAALLATGILATTALRRRRKA